MARSERCANPLFERRSRCGLILRKRAASRARDRRRCCAAGLAANRRSIYPPPLDPCQAHVEASRDGRSFPSCLRRRIDVFRPSHRRRRLERSRSPRPPGAGRPELAATARAQDLRRGTAVGRAAADGPAAACCDAAVRASGQRVRQRRAAAVDRRRGPPSRSTRNCASSGVLEALHDLASPRSTVVGDGAVQRIASQELVAPTLPIAETPSPIRSHSG